jgi:hypothetical protein
MRLNRKSSKKGVLVQALTGKVGKELPLVLKAHLAEGVFVFPLHIFVADEFLLFVGAQQ